MVDGKVLTVEREELIDEKLEKVKFSGKEESLGKLDVLKLVGSGTELRKGLDNVVRARKGAIIVINNTEAGKVFSGGFKVNCPFSPEKLFELSKMDGGIIVSGDFKKIMFANTLLSPDIKYDTTETGIRHQSAERTAKQIKGLVLTVSERRGNITIYYGNSKYVLKSTNELLSRAAETLQVLEKERESLDELLTNLDVLEITNLVSVKDVVSIFQRIESINKMVDIINDYIIELGEDGVILRMRMSEITNSLVGVREGVILDYIKRPKRLNNFFSQHSFSDLLNSVDIGNYLFKKSLEADIVPKGYRLLGKTNMDKRKVNNLVNKFKNLKKILESDEEEMKKYLKKDYNLFNKEINNLREHIMVGKKI